MKQNTQDIATVNTGNAAANDTKAQWAGAQTINKDNTISQRGYTPPSGCDTTYSPHTTHYTQHTTRRDGQDHLSW